MPMAKRKTPAKKKSTKKKAPAKKGKSTSEPPTAGAFEFICGVLLLVVPMLLAAWVAWECLRLVVRK